MVKVASADNLADPFTKPLSQKVFEKHIKDMGLRYMYDWVWRFVFSLLFDNEVYLFFTYIIAVMGLYVT